MRRGESGGNKGDDTGNRLPWAHGSITHHVDPWGGGGGDAGTHVAGARVDSPGLTKHFNVNNDSEARNSEAGPGRGKSLYLYLLCAVVLKE